jgi:TolA-binding protein
MTLTVGLCLTVSCSQAPLPASFRHGERMERAKRYGAALDAYRQATTACGTRHRECAVAHLRVAEMHFKLGQWRAAQETYRDLARWTTDVPLASRAAFRAAAIDEENLQRPDAARTGYLDLLKRYPEQVAAEDALRRLCASFRATSKAADLARLLLELYRNQPRTAIADDLLYEAAMLYQKHNRLTEALQLLGTLVRAHPNSPLWHVALFRVAQLEERDGRWESAIASYRRLTATRKDAWLVGSENSVLLDDAQLRLGWVYWKKLRRADKALAAWNELIEKYSHSLLRDDALLHVAELEHERGARVRACQVLQQLIQRFPDGNRVRAAHHRISSWGCGSKSSAPRP